MLDAPTTTNSTPPKAIDIDIMETKRRLTQLLSSLYPVHSDGHNIAPDTPQSPRNVGSNNDVHGSMSLLFIQGEREPLLLLGAAISL